MNPFLRFVIRLVIVLAILGAIVGGAFLFSPGGRQTASATTTAEAQTVVVTPAASHDFERSLRVVGSLEPARFAMVSARIPGVLDEILVDEGDAVVAGETVLFKTDSLKLGKALEIARQDEAVAASALLEREAYLEQVEADHHQALLDVERFRRLVDKGAATARHLEQQESRFAQVTAGIKHAKALVALAKTQAGQAVVATAIAQKDLDDATVRAPIDGRVTVRFREPGEDAGKGKPILRIENLTALDVSLFLPEEVYSKVRPGSTSLRVRVGDVDLGDIRVTWRSPTVDIMLRTFEAKARLETPESSVVPGRLADVDVVLDERTGLGVPTGAILHRRQGTIVFVVRDGVAIRRMVTTGLASRGWTEITGDGLSAGDAVVTTGQEYIEDGTSVRPVEETR
jgi:RND family efflux transporter MFP subunit